MIAGRVWDVLALPVAGILCMSARAPAARQPRPSPTATIQFQRQSELRSLAEKKSNARSQRTVMLGFYAAAEDESDDDMGFSLFG